MENVVVEGIEGGAGRGSIAERRAATLGFKADKICPPNIEIGSLVLDSPCLTISPGISPTALLDSSVMLSNSSPPSPTSGMFVLPLHRHESEVLNSLNLMDGQRGRIPNCSSTSKLNTEFNSMPGFSRLENQKGEVEYQPPAPMDLDFGLPSEFSKVAVQSGSAVDDGKCLSNIGNDDFSNQEFSSSKVANVQSCNRREPSGGEDASMHLLDGEQKETNPSMEMTMTSEDGYNWRKYGQKQVKGSECPRSYYKCTHPNCQVKKKVERSLDGQITEIIYRSAHNHPKPLPSRRASLGSSFSTDELSEMADGSQAYLKGEGGSVWRNVQVGLKDSNLVSQSSDRRADGMERKSSTSTVTHASDPSLTAEGKSLGVLDSAETPGFQSTLASHNDDRAIQGNMSFYDDPADDDESESKRRKTESCPIETNMASRAIREPRVVVQIESDVDILDDGYRWRKYGQKVVKGNPNPRSYYKCTSPGCPVRKHIERASDNLKCVLTTYEGKHNHEVPAARNSNHVNMNGSSIPTTMANTQPGDNSGFRPKSQIPGITNPFNRKHEFSNGYPRAPFIGNFSNELKCGASIFQMEFPPLQSLPSYNPFGPNSSNGSAHSVGSVVMEYPFSLPLRLQHSTNFSLHGFDISNGKPGFAAQSFLPGQHLKEEEMPFLRPKMEKIDDNLYDACYPFMDHALASPTVYHQM